VVLKVVTLHIDVVGYQNLGGPYSGLYFHPEDHHLETSNLRFELALNFFITKLNFPRYGD
jgi:hypothetical protein